MTDNFFSYIGKRIRFLMRSQDITFQELSRRSGVAKKTIELAIREPENRTLKTLKKIADGLNVSVHYLLDPFVPQNTVEMPYKRVIALLPQGVASLLEERSKELGIPQNIYVGNIILQTLQHQQDQGQHDQRTKP